MRNTFFLLALAAASQAVAVSPYISKVYEYRPAPGQFINVLPEIPAEASADEVNALVLEQIGHEKNAGMISLGAFGGYVVFGFDHPVVNVEGAYDFKIYGNAFMSASATNGGSCEPGIVMVSEDINGDGLPNDPWYELAGSEYHKDSTFKGFRITYHKTPADHLPVADPANRQITDTEYIRFTTNQPGYESGWLQQNVYHRQNYWPEWTDAETLEFEGSRLADNSTDTSGNGTYWVLGFYDYGYVDNLSNDVEPGFKIDWAVDADGNPVKLGKIDFIKVYTAVSQTCGWIGETSTEICGGEDLHPDALGVEGIEAASFGIGLIAAREGTLTVRSGSSAPFALFTSGGAKTLEGVLAEGDNSIDASRLPSGVYLLHAAGKTLKVCL